MDHDFAECILFMMDYTHNYVYFGLIENQKT